MRAPINIERYKDYIGDSNIFGVVRDLKRPQSFNDFEIERIEEAVFPLREIA